MAAKCDYPSAIHIFEMHFQQYGSRCRMWVPPEVKEPVCCRITPRARAWAISGAVRLRDGKHAKQNRFDAASTWAFLRFLHQHSRQRRSSLSPIERVWKLTRKYFPILGALVAALEWPSGQKATIRCVAASLVYSPNLKSYEGRPC